MKVFLGGLAGVVLGAASAIVIGRYAFDRRVSGEIQELLGPHRTASHAGVSADQIAALPEPVQRWLRWSGAAVDRSIPATVRLRQQGELRLGGRGWVPFTAEEYYSTQPPAFLWKADVSIAPGVHVVGKDSYLGGRGTLEMRLLGLFPVAQDEGADMDKGDLLRFLNEIMWFPGGALLPEISWEAIDDDSARAVLSHGGVSGTAVFFFDAEGRPTNMAADRFDRDYGAVVPWSTPFHAYGEFDGVRVPTEGEAVYTREEGNFEYIRVTVIDVDYNVSSPY